MAPIISTTVQWVILPAIMSAIFVLAWIIANSTRTAELRVSAWAGFWAGLLAFVVYVVSQLGQMRDPDFQYAALPGLMFMPLTSGLFAGFVFLGLVRVTVPTRLVGLITLTLTGASTSALFTYVFISSLRVSVLYCALGSAWASSCISSSTPRRSGRFSRWPPGRSQSLPTPCTRRSRSSPPCCRNEGRPDTASVRKGSRTKPAPTRAGFWVLLVGGDSTRRSSLPLRSPATADVTDDS